MTFNLGTSYLISATDSNGNQNYYMHNGQGSVANVVDYSGNGRRCISTMRSGASGELPFAATVAA